MTTPRVPVSWGELLDKITILEIKAERIDVPAKQANVLRELHELLKAADAARPRSWTAEIDELCRELRAINEALWEIEDEIRLREDQSDFGPAFVTLAREVYRTNDKRAAVKRLLNERLLSVHIEEKHFTSLPKARA